MMSVCAAPAGTVTPTLSVPALFALFAVHPTEPSTLAAAATAAAVRHPAIRHSRLLSRSCHYDAEQRSQVRRPTHPHTQLRPALPISSSFSAAKVPVLVERRARREAAD